MDKDYKLIIFDFVDTLANGHGIAELTTLIEKELGREAINLMIDGGKIDTEKSADDIIARVRQFKPVTPDQETLIRKWIFPGNITLLPDSREILQYLKNKGYTLGIISNTPPTEQDTLKTLGIDHFVDCALYSFECGYRKPEKQIFELMLNKMEVTPDEALMIGDSLKNDIIGAQSVGIDAILFDMNNQIDFDPKIASLRELKQIL